MVEDRRGGKRVKELTVGGAGDGPYGLRVEGRSALGEEITECGLAQGRRTSLFGRSRFFRSAGQGAGKVLVRPQPFKASEWHLWRPRFAVYRSVSGLIPFSLRALQLFREIDDAIKVAWPTRAVVSHSGTFNIEMTLTLGL
jgi:hypothetical protein